MRFDQCIDEARAAGKLFATYQLVGMGGRVKLIWFCAECCRNAHKKRKIVHSKSCKTNVKNLANVKNLVISDEDVAVARVIASEMTKFSTGRRVF